MRLNFSNVSVTHSDNSIFLAGPTYRDTDYSQSWRKDAVKILTDINFDGIVYIPEYPVNTPFNDNNIEKQTNWEWEALDCAGVILFWIPREINRLPGFTTNIEFGRYITKRPQTVILGYPENAQKMKYLELLYRKETGRAHAETLEQTIEQAITLLH